MTVQGATCTMRHAHATSNIQLQRATCRQDFASGCSSACSEGRPVLIQLRSGIHPAALRRRSRPEAMLGGKDARCRTSFGSEKSTSGGGGAGAMSFAHHGGSGASLSSPSFPVAAANVMSAGGGPTGMLLNIRTSATLRPSITAKIIPPTSPAFMAALAPPREASIAPVQKPDIYKHTTHDT